MRIGIFDPYLDDLGGGEKYMMTLAKCLSQENIVTVFWNKPEDLKKVAERFSLDVSRIKIKENIFSSNYSFFKRCLASLKYDAIVVLSDGSMPFVLSKLFIHFQQPFPEIKTSLKTSIKKNRVSAFFCNSYFTKSFIDKEFGVNSKVIYPPVDIANKTNKKQNIILHVGRFRAVNIGSEDYKKQGVMINIFKKMIDDGLKDWKFILAVGLHGEDRAKFNELQKEANGYPIEFLVNLNKGNLDKVYSKAKIYWHASGFGENLDKFPQRAEHFGISTVEAMGAGAVPIVINAGGQKEIVSNERNGFLWNTLSEFKDKTNLLIKNESLWKKMSESAMNRAKAFSQDRFCKEIKDIVNQ